MNSLDGATDLKLEVVVLPVSDVDRARSLYMVSEQSGEEAPS